MKLISKVQTRQFFARVFGGFDMRPLAILILVLLGLSACQTKEEKVAEHLEKARAFIEADDPARARVELLNVLRATPNDVSARHTLVDMEMALGNRRAAFGQLQRIVEQDPRHIESRLQLARLMMEQRNWTQAEAQLQPIAQVARDNFEFQIAQAIVTYSQAAGSDDALALLGAHGKLLEFLPKAPGDLILRAAIIDGYDRTGRPTEALMAADEALALAPKNIEFAQARLSLLLREGREEEAIAQLEAMVRAHPEIRSLRHALVGKYVDTDNLDAAEALLRDVPDPGDPADQLALIRFLADFRGNEQALVTLERLVVAHGRPTVLRLLRAVMAFDDADVSGALTEMREAVTAAQDAGEDTSGALYLLAQMLDAAGDRPAAESALNSLLESDPRNVAGAQLQSVWLMERGRPDLALRLLRAAEGVDVDHPTTLLLLSRAYDALGDTALGAQMLARAFEESGHSAITGLDYATRLVGQGQLSSAMEVLSRAAETDPENVAVLKRLGVLAIAQEQWDRAESIEGRLRVIASAPARMIADDLQFRRQIDQGKPDLALTQVALRAKSGELTPTGLALIARSALEVGDTELTRSLLELGTTAFPLSNELGSVEAELAVAEGALTEAADVYEALTAVAPQSETLWSDFIALRKRQSDPELLVDTIRQARLTVPDSPTLAWEEAATLEAMGRRDDALMAYEALYETYPSNASVRNNLAALLLADQPRNEDLERAAALVEPLVGSPIPQFQDTIGWLRHLQGDHAAATSALVPAAEALPDDAQVQWHAAEALRAADEVDRSRRYYLRVAEIGDEDLAGKARNLVAVLDSATPEQATD